MSFLIYDIISSVRYTYLILHFSLWSWRFFNLIFYHEVAKPILGFRKERKRKQERP